MHETPQLKAAPKFSWLRTLPWVIGGLLLAYFYAYFTAMTTGDVDLVQCHALEAAVTAKSTIPPSVSSPGRPGIFCDRAIRLPFLMRYEKVYVYGVTNVGAQDTIVQTLGDFPGAHDGKVLVEFFAKENWAAWSHPATGDKGGQRGTETPLRTIWID